MRYLVVHAHLYQPPRENPWTEKVHRQPSAAPFHNWNVRVASECYERLGAAGMRGPDGRINALVNLFGRISFNIGPTLASWLEEERPEVLDDARQGDLAARERTGSGGAMMQAYGHPILPLAAPREKRLQVAWGKAEFQRRFGRDPLGIWLPETAVDLETLEVCADFGLKYTILAPEQIVQVRRSRSRKWQDVSGGRTPTHKPLYVKLPSGRRFTIFVFHGPLSRNIAFGGTLSSGERLLGEMRHALEHMPGEPGLVLMAADGETFGHHQRGAEAVLAEALVRCRLSGMARVSHLGEVLEDLTPSFEARLAEPSAWSCSHGVGRWSRDCGCRMGDHGEGWTWDWREPLRHAVSTLRDRVFTLIDRRGDELFKDPWAALEAHGEVLAFPPERERLEALIDEHAALGLSAAERNRAAKLLELTRQVLFSATSCGWFFDDIAGIESTQVLRHAARACELTQQVFGVDPEPTLVKRLADAPANEEGFETGADVYQRRARSARHEPRVALACRGLGRLQDALAGMDALEPCTATFGLFTVKENGPPVVEREAGGLVRVRGRCTATHLRSGESCEGEYESCSPAPGEAVSILVEGERAETLCSMVNEQALAIAASRAAALLPAPDPELLTRLAWISREARGLGAPLPSPFGEAISGGARAMIRECLHRKMDAPEEVQHNLLQALKAATASGLGHRELEDLAPAMTIRLAALTTWVLDEPHTKDALASMSELIELAHAAMGDPVLGRTRRVLVDRPEDQEAAPVEVLARAAGMSLEALQPVDVPVRAARSRRVELSRDELI